MTDLDILLRECKPGATIKLNPTSLYVTKGFGQSGSPNEPTLPIGASIQGEGATVLCTPANPFVSFDVLMLGGENAVSSVAFHVNPTSHISGRKINGISCKTGAVILDSCLLSGTHGTQDKESFGFYLLGVDNQLTNCTFANPGGSYVNSFRVDSGIITNCDAIFPPYSIFSEVPFHVAFNIGSSTDLSILNCRVVNGRDALYADWKTTRNVTVKNSSFVGCKNGLYLNALEVVNQPHQIVMRDIELTANTILLNGADAKQVNALMAVHTFVSDVTNPANLITKIRVHRNTIGFDRSDVKPPVRYAANIVTDVSDPNESRGISAIEMTENDVDPAFAWRDKGRRAKLIASTRSEPLIITD